MQYKSYLCIFNSTTSLQEFLKDFIEKIYLGHVHFSVSNNINLATKGTYLLKIEPHYQTGDQLLSGLGICY